ncbi:hypothetical protein ABZ714_33935 [Streptomyces sp. NPDC006798]|uniref:hypothetical protein n=1 Tax=Streptomyces sp. NPDC006798 TaxID=3155462 RepID=UPI0033F41B66
MRRNKHDKNAGVEAGAAWPFGPGDYMWHAMARLAGTHHAPVLASGPFARPAGVLSFLRAPDVILASRVQLTGAQTLSELHDLVATATRGIDFDARTLGPGIALEILIGKRQDLALHDDHLTGLTRLLLEGADTIGAPGIARPPHCAHCGGSGEARPLWGHEAGVTACP